MPCLQWEQNGNCLLDGVNSLEMVGVELFDDAFPRPPPLVHTSIDRVRCHGLGIVDNNESMFLSKLL